MANWLLPGYQLITGSGLEQARLVKFMHLTYQELYPNQDFSHLTQTVDRYFSGETPLWWVKVASPEFPTPQLSMPELHPVACLWLGNAVDQVTGDRHAHIFLLYVMPEHRRRGIGKSLMGHAEDWARARGDHQMGLQVFQTNQPAVHLYDQLGYKTQSLWMIKPLYSIFQVNRPQ